MRSAPGTLAVVVPTRNRSALAMNAVRSVLSQQSPGVTLMVTENSTDPAEREKVARFCDEHRHEGVQMVHPPEPLSMSANWNFALEAALAIPGVTHALILTDRMLFKPGELPVLFDVVRDHPDRVIIFTEDRAYDDRNPVGLVQSRWTGKLVEISSVQLLQLASRMQLHPAPRIMNSVVPRRVFDTVRARFGAITGSAAPDYAFAYRCLAVEDSLLYFDRAPVVYYAWSRSNGMSFARGLTTADSADFVRNLPPQERMNGFSPIPELPTVVNAIVNEYCRVQKETGGERFPPIDRSQYLLANEAEISRDMRNDELRQQLQRIIDAQPPFSRRPTLFRLVQRVLAVRDLAVLRPLWRFLASGPGFAPPGDSPVPLGSTREALDLIARRPRRRHLSDLHLRLLFGRAREIGVYTRHAGGRFPADLHV